MSTCIAAVALARAEAGHRDTINDVPSWQWQIWWGDLRPYCPDALSPPLERRRANALNVEIGQPLQRCKVRSPDGRGLAWLAPRVRALRARSLSPLRRRQCWPLTK